MWPCTPPVSAGLSAPLSCRCRLVERQRESRTSCRELPEADSRSPLGDYRDRAALELEELGRWRELGSFPSGSSLHSRRGFRALRSATYPPEAFKALAGCGPPQPACRRSITAFREAGGREKFTFERIKAYENVQEKTRFKDELSDLSSQLVDGCCAFVSGLASSKASRAPFLDKIQPVMHKAPESNATQKLRVSCDLKAKSK
jgi:hypothetical protein